MLKLWCAPGTISVAVAIALEETGQDWEARLLDFAAGEQRGADYLSRNPKGRVPLLETPEGDLTETGAILEYVAPDLVPAAPVAAARMRETMYYLASTMHVAHAHGRRGGRWADDPAALTAMAAKVPQTMTECCTFLEGHLPLAPFAQGDTMTCADPYLFAVLRWCAGDGVNMTAFPKLSAFLAMMAARASVAAVRDMGLLP